jgi:hypothetical protein
MWGLYLRGAFVAGLLLFPMFPLGPADADAALAARARPVIFVEDFHGGFDERHPALGEGAGIAAALTIYTTQWLNDNYTCADVYNHDTIAALLGWGRQQSALGTPEETAVRLADVLQVQKDRTVVVRGNLSGWDEYLQVDIEFYTAEDKLRSGSFRIERNAKVEALLPMAEKVLDGMRISICPWAGTVTLKVEQGRDELDQERLDDGMSSSVDRYSSVYSQKTVLKANGKMETTFEYRDSSLREQRVARTMKGCLADHGQFADRSYSALTRETRSAHGSGTSAESSWAKFSMDDKGAWRLSLRTPDVDGKVQTSYLATERGGCAQVNESEDRSQSEDGQRLWSQWIYSLSGTVDPAQKRLSLTRVLKDQPPDIVTISLDLQR